MHLPSFSVLLGFINLPGGGEWIILLIIGLLIFGRRLPEVGRSIGRSIVEFKRGIKDIQDDVEEESSHPPKRLPRDQSAELPEAAGRREQTPAPAAAKLHDESA